MKRPLRRAGLALAAVLALAALVPQEASARGGFRGGGFRSSSSFRSFTPSRSSGFSLRPSSTFKSTKPSTGLSGWGRATRPSSTSPAATPRLSLPVTGGAAATGGATATPLGRTAYSSQRSVYESARRSGTLFSSKAEAESAFASKYRSQYASTFASEPSTRPAWIPSSTLVGGTSYPVVYNQGLGGYGYYNSALGRWILFDAMADSLVLGSLMGHHNYYYGAPAYAGFGWDFRNLALVLLLAVIVVVALSAARNRRRWR